MQRRWGMWMLLLGACSSETEGDRDASDGGTRDAAADARSGDGRKDAKTPTANVEGVTLRANVQPITRADDALQGVFIPPYVSCQPPRDGEPAGKGPDGQVCTNVAISGATEPGRRFADYASCDIVVTQRPFWSAPPAYESKPDDPRLQDQAYLKELGWVSEQIEASGCVCCHDSKVLGKQAGEWDIRLGPLWLDSLTDTGLALFAGLADSSVLGAYHPEDNNGFDRAVTGIPSDDSPRMKKFMLAELARRGISEDEARAVPPFGGPIYANRVAAPTACAPGEGVAPDGTIQWNRGDARYVYVMREESENPGVPPNLDLPEGTLFRLDVLASKPPLASGVPYGTTPPGSFQSFPVAERAPKLALGTRYHLYVLEDVGIPLANCLFTFGDELPIAAADASVPDAATPGGPGGDAGGCALPQEGFGAVCKTDSDCPCAANYCALMPGQASGSCTRTGCKEDASVCPSGWSCFDLSLFAASLPSICTE